MADRPKAPTSEIGVPSPNYAVAGGPLGSIPWSQFIDEREYASDLRWPASVRIYDRIQSGDAQAAGLLLTLTMSVRRMLYEIDPNDAPAAIVDHVAEAHGIPARGEPRPASPRFNHDRHLSYALTALGYGHTYFEVVYEILDNGFAFLKKLGTRPPRTIVNFIVAPNGDLLGIVQNVGLQVTGKGLLDTGLGGRAIDANRLLPYVWAPADDGDWIGRSMLRPLYRNWLLKDRLIRVDATKHERNGMGIPWYETDPNASKQQIDDLAAMAEAIRAGTRGGGAGPGKLRIAAPEGQIPDTIASVRYHDEQMSKAFQTMVQELAGSSSGNRALGDTFVDLALQMQDTIADWYCKATQAQIDDEVLINWGPDVPAPQLRATRLESEALALKELAEGVKSGLIAVTPEMRAQIAERYQLAGQSEEAIASLPKPSPPPPAAPPPPDEGEPTPAPAAAARRPQSDALADEMVTALTGPMPWPALAEAVGRDRRDGTARRARDRLVTEGAILKRRDGTLAPMAELRLPDRELRRNPKPFEVEAAVDFAAMEQTYVDARESLVAAVKSMQGAQIDEARAAVEAADGDAATLAAIKLDPVDADVIAEHLEAVAHEGIASAKAEHDAQTSGAAAVAAAEPSAAAIETAVRERAEAVALTLAGGFSAAASKRASAVATLPPEAAAADVAAYLGGLSDAELDLQLGGAVQQAYNTGRRDYMTANKPSTVYASEILDGATCSNCASIDGTEWPTVADAEESYPLGGYVECEAGLRCRGTLVAVY